MGVTHGSPTTELGAIRVSGDDRFVEFGPPGRRRQLRLHDYAGIYAEPGLYERIFIDELDMRSSYEVAAIFGRTLRQLERDPADQYVLDLGAGNGVGGAALRALGVGTVIAVDNEPAAAVAAARDRPGVYEDYVVADLAGPHEGLRAHRFTAIVALSAIGIGHVPPDALGRALGLLDPGGVYAFAVTPTLLPGSRDEAGRASGYPAFLEELLANSTELARRTYVHRKLGDGSDEEAVAFVGSF